MLKQNLRNDLNQAVKDKNEIVSGTLRMVLSSISNKEKEKRYKIVKQEPELSESDLAEKFQLTDEEIVGVVSSEIKKRKEAIADYEKGGRQDLADKEKAEIKVLEKYLPEQMPESEIRKLVESAIEKTGASEIKDMGRVMGELMPKVKGRADGNEVSRIIKEMLGGNNA